jgi:hypothetical protein
MFGTNIKSIAEKDASKWAYAEMFFGEGAGTRRKLLQAEINHKIKSVPGYEQALKAAYDRQDMAKHAIKAAKERQRLDRTQFMSRNLRGLILGNKRSLSTSIGLVVTTWSLLHQTGLDKEIGKWLKPRIERLKDWWRNERAKRKARRIMGRG